MCKRKPGVIIYRLNNLIGRVLSQRQTEEERELSSLNGRIIRFVDANEGRDVYQKDVEKEFGVTRSTASRVLMLMEQKGLVERCGVSHDARLKKLVLTERARHFSQIMHERGEQLDRILLNGFTPEETEQFYRFMERMTQNVSAEMKP